MTTQPTPAFSLEPGLPWLRTDPAMQQSEAFIGVDTFTLSTANGKPYEPMSRHFPLGATLARVRVTRPEDFTEGVYWHQQTHSGLHANLGTRCAFGRFAGLTPTGDERAEARRLKRGQLHFDLAADVLANDLRTNYCLREDGTQTCYMDFNDVNFELWRITHYVSLPAPLLARLGRAQAQATGTTAEQQRWLTEEKSIIADDAYEFTAHVLGSFPEPDCRAVLCREQRGNFNCLMNSLPRLAPSQAKKRKSGAVAIQWRFYTAYGNPVTLTDYFKREDADLLLGWLQSTTDQWRAQARVLQHSLAVEAAANAIRAAWETHAAPAQATPHYLGPQLTSPSALAHAA